MRGTIGTLLATTCVLALAACNNAPSFDKDWGQRWIRAASATPR